jgi:hypothetical protein
MNLFTVDALDFTDAYASVDAPLGLGLRPFRTDFPSFNFISETLTYTRGKPRRR